MDIYQTLEKSTGETTCPNTNNAPIGIFDSGFGGLTVAREVAKAFPHESIIYVGDSARCPYGTRSLAEVSGFVEEIGGWLVTRGVKLIVIACNTATIAGLKRAQQLFPVPVLGVVVPGARAAAIATKNRRVGVIATEATIQSGMYPKAIKAINRNIEVFSVAAPRFVEMAERGVGAARGPIEDFSSIFSASVCPECQKIAQEYLMPLQSCGIDTLVLGCTHFPLLKDLISATIGSDVVLISSGKEVSYDVGQVLADGCSLADGDHEARYEFFTTGSDVEGFRVFGSRVFCRTIDTAARIEFLSHKAK